MSNPISSSEKVAITPTVVNSTVVRLGEWGTKVALLLSSRLNNQALSKGWPVPFPSVFEDSKVLLDSRYRLDPSPRFSVRGFTLYCQYLDITPRETLSTRLSWFEVINPPSP